MLFFMKLWSFGRNLKVYIEKLKSCWQYDDSMATLYWIYMGFVYARLKWGVSHCVVGEWNVSWIVAVVLFDIFDIQLYDIFYFHTLIFKLKQQ